MSGIKRTNTSVIKQNEYKLKGITYLQDNDTTHIDNSLNVIGDTFLNSSLTTTGQSTLYSLITSGDVSLNSNVDISGYLEVGGNSTFNGNVTTSGNLIVEGNLRVDNEIIIEENTIISWYCSDLVSKTLDNEYTNYPFNPYRNRLIMILEPCPQNNKIAQLEKDIQLLKDYLQLK